MITPLALALAFAIVPAMLVAFAAQRVAIVRRDLADPAMPADYRPVPQCPPISALPPSRQAVWGLPFVPCEPVPTPAAHLAVRAARVAPLNAFAALFAGYCTAKAISDVTGENIRGVRDALAALESCGLARRSPRMGVACSQPWVARL